MHPKKLKIVILTTGNNIFGREIVSLISSSEFKISGVIEERGSRYAQKCRPYLRNNFYRPASRSQLIKKYNTHFFYTKNLNSRYCYKKLMSLAPDIVALGGARILKPHIINSAKIGVINCHPGLLPQYRGMDPVGWAIYNGDPIGITCHFVDKGIDTGAILIKQKATWHVGESLLGIRVRIMRDSAKVMLCAIRGLAKGSLKPKPQRGKANYHSALPADVVEKVNNILLGKVKQ